MTQKGWCPSSYARFHALNKIVSLCNLSSLEDHPASAAVDIHHLPLFGSLSVVGPPGMKTSSHASNKSGKPPPVPGGRRGKAGEGGRKAAPSNESAKKTPAPAARIGTRRTSPRHPPSHNSSAAAALTDLALSTNKASTTPQLPGHRLVFSNNNDVNNDDVGEDDDGEDDKDPDLSQSLLFPLPPLGTVVTEGGKGVEESQLTTGTGLGDNNDDDGMDTNFIESFDHHYSDDDSKDEDAHINDYAANTYDFNQRMHHYMEYCAISPRTVRAVEYCCMTQANTVVCNGITKGKTELDTDQLREYMQLIRDIPDSYLSITR